MPSSGRPGWCVELDGGANCASVVPGGRRIGFPDVDPEEHGWEDRDAVRIAEAIETGDGRARSQSDPTTGSRVNASSASTTSAPSPKALLIEPITVLSAAKFAEVCRALARASGC